MPSTALQKIHYPDWRTQVIELGEDLLFDHAPKVDQRSTRRRLFVRPIEKISDSLATWIGAKSGHH
jgi:hypothetical protein